MSLTTETLKKSGLPAATAPGFARVFIGEQVADLAALSANATHLSDEAWAALVAPAAVSDLVVGQVAWVFSFGAYRRGVVVKLGRTRATVAFVTETDLAQSAKSGYASTIREIAAPTAGLKVEPAVEEPAVEEPAVEEPAVEVVDEPAAHNEGCVDFAAYRAFENYAVDEYPSPAATRAGLDYLDADIVDCTCATYVDDAQVDDEPAAEVDDDQVDDAQVDDEPASGAVARHFAGEAARTAAAIDLAGPAAADDEIRTGDRVQGRDVTNGGQMTGNVVRVLYPTGLGYFSAVPNDRAAYGRRYEIRTDAGRGAIVEVAARVRAMPEAGAGADVDDVLAEIRAAQMSTSTIVAEAVRRADEFRRELAGIEGAPAIEARQVREARFAPASTVTYLPAPWRGRRFHRDLVDLVDEARRTDAGVDLDDDEQLDPAEAVRLLDDPATWERVRAALRERGFDVDDELVEQVRRAAGREPR